MAKKPDATQLAVDRIIERLEQRRSLGDDHYPVPRGTLLSEVLGDAEPGLATKLPRNRAFKQRVALSHPTHPDAPLTLLEDVQRLAASPQLFAFATAQAGGDPPWVLAELAKQVGTNIRPQFAECLQQRLREGTTQELVAHADDQLAARLLRILANRFARPDASPTTLSELARDMNLDPIRQQARIKRAAGRPAFAGHTVALRPKTLDAPLVPTAQAQRLATAPQTLPYLLRTARTASKHLFTVAELAKKAPAELRPPIEQHARDMVDRGSLAPQVIAVRDGKRIKFFLLDDLEPLTLRRRLEEVLGSGDAARDASLSETPAAAEAATNVAAPAAISHSPARAESFPSEFSSAFERLDRAAGSYNQVSLAALRQALPEWPREAFDSALLELRRSGQYALSGLQNRFGISPTEQQAGIQEGGHLLLYVSQKR